MFLRTLIFLILNFLALGLGSFFTADGVASLWYQNLAKAPWSPPGWMFGAAWTSIMICFSVYMAYLWPLVQSNKKLILLYAMQWILNVSWNPTFFYFHQISLAFFIIVGLTLLVAYFLFDYRLTLKLKSLLLLPYFIWLLIASSLNGYILIFN